MSIYTKESNVIKFIQNKIDLNSVVFHTESENACKVFDMIYDKKKWKKWIDSSGHADKTPDFFSDHFGYMMEVMEIDDHGHIDERGKLVNPTTKKEGDIEKVLHQKNGRLWASCILNLQTDDDHNFEWYLDNFKRIVDQHAKQVNVYRENHPNCKLIFLIVDESSSYWCKHWFGDVLYRIGDANSIRGHLHRAYLDKSFLEIVYNSKADYCIWMMPYKSISNSDGLQEFNKVHVFDLSKKCKTKKYYHNKIVPCEKNPMDSEMKKAENQFKEWLINKTTTKNISFDIKCVDYFDHKNEKICFIVKYREKNTKKWKLGVVYESICLSNSENFKDNTAINKAKDLMKTYEFKS